MINYVDSGRKTLSSLKLLKLQCQKQLESKTKCMGCSFSCTTDSDSKCMLGVPATWGVGMERPEGLEPSNQRV